MARRREIADLLLPAARMAEGSLDGTVELKGFHSVFFFFFGEFIACTFACEGNKLSEMNYKHVNIISNINGN